MIGKFLIPIVAVLGPAVAVAQAPSGAAPAVQVWLNDNGSYKQGDRMRVFFETDRDAYVTVVRVTTEGHVRVLFPEIPTENNYVAGNAEYEVIQYGRGDYRVHDAPGHGYVFAVASLRPFDYSNFSSGPSWDYHLLNFGEESEADRDPYDTFAHFMDDILEPESTEFSYQAAAYSVDERNTRYYANSYRYFATPYYHECHIYRAFWGLRPRYIYDYDCRRVGVTITYGLNGHYYHDDYYHYGYYTGSIPYYYGYGSVYRYRYDSGHYRHNHGARRVTGRALAGYQGLDRHSVSNGRRMTGRRSAGASGGQVASSNNRVPRRRTTAAGSPVRRSPIAQGSSGSRPTSRANTTSRRRTTNSGSSAATPNTGPSEQDRRNVRREENGGRRRPELVRPTPNTRPAPTPRGSSGSLTRRRAGSSDSSARPSTSQRRQASTPRTSDRSTGSTRSTPRRSSPSAGRSTSRPRSTGSAPRRSGGGSSVGRTPSRQPSGSGTPNRSTGSSRRRPG